MAAHDDWRELYRGALMESDPETLAARIEIAYRAIQHRALQLWYMGTPETNERLELDSALHFLTLLSIVGPVEGQRPLVNRVAQDAYDS